MKKTYILPKHITYDSISENRLRGGLCLDRCIREACRVCGRKGYGKEYNSIFAEDLIKYNDVFYIVFEIDEACRALFELNPLAYERTPEEIRIDG